MEFRKIKSLDNLYEINEDGTVFRNVKTKRELKIKLDMHHSKKGYYTSFVHFGGRQPGNYCKRVMIHKIVAECWLGECPDGYEIDHIDRNSRNNNYKNLRYVTKSEQMKNRDHSGISKIGNKNLVVSREKRMVGILLIKNTEELFFKNMMSCADYLSKKYNNTTEHFRYLLRRRVNEILDYKVYYKEPNNCI